MIYVEGFADEKLLTSLGIPSKKVKIANNIRNVCNKLLAGSNLVGMIDEDINKPKPKYYKQLLNDINSKIIENLFFIVLVDKRRTNKLVILRPELETWLSKLSIHEKINIANYNIESDFSGFKTSNNIKLQKLENFVSGNKNAKLFKELITYIKK